MFAAFKVPNTEMYKVADPYLLQTQDFDDKIILEADDVESPEDNENETPDAAKKSETNAQPVQLIRNGCNSHLIQRGIITAIEENAQVQDLIQKVNAVVKFFHVCHRYYEELKKINGNLALLRPVVTRWNSQFHSLKRIFEHGPNKVRYNNFIFLSPD